MSTVLRTLVGLFAGVGVTATVVVVSGVVYATNKLNEAGNGYKFGPARKAAYYSDILHRASRDIDSAAIDISCKAQQEDRLDYDRMVDERVGSADIKVKRNTKSNK